MPRKGRGVQPNPIPNATATANAYAALKAHASGGQHERELWGAVDALVLRSFIEAVTSNGDGCTFARTRDGGAMALVLLTGGEQIRLYTADCQQMEADLLSTTAALRQPA
jgi:hypothetical protein